ncbi:MAG TPA: CAP domain-containing protein [Ktedonobacteraceae bacterium]|nr:CAP domain-containing protein [Ktedonobacteraceae bacterium]
MAFRKSWLLVAFLSLAVLLSACGGQVAKQASTVGPALNNAINESQNPVVPQAPIVLKKQVATPTSTPTPRPTVKPTQAPVPTSPPAPPQGAPPTNIPGTGTGAAPYGPPPAMSSEEIQLTQQLFTLINSDRAVRGLYAFTWNATLAGGARLHSWNMFHCGFSHTCPDGLPQCTRIANEGFAGYTDCGECIGYAGPYPTPYGGMHNIQESMVNETSLDGGPPWHRIHLLSTTLHRGGVGIYVDAGGYIWFTEDFVS